MENNKKKSLAIVLGVFALVIVTTAASFAFFTYSRIGETTSTIISGDIEFSFIEGASATLPNAFPVADSIGAVDTTGEYLFDVKLISSSQANKMNYNVLLLDANDEVGVKYFNNEQIKFSLVKNNTYVANTSPTKGVKLSEIDGFNELSNQGEGIVLDNQEITPGTIDHYKLRIWIADDVDYSNTVDGQDEQESLGKYNSYKYSLRVKINGSSDGSYGFLDLREVAFDANGGISTKDKKMVEYTGTYGDLPTATKEGHNFLGWYTNIVDGTPVTSETIYNTLEANVLYAHWEKGLYTLTIDPKEGTYENTTAVTSYNLEYEEEKEIADPTRVGYTFNNWIVTGNKTTYQDGTLKMGSENSSLIANWTINNYKLTVDPKGGIWNSSTSSQEFTINYKGTKEIPDPTKDGHTFTGWQIEGSNATLNTKTFVIGESDAKLTATWEANDYKYITKHYQQNVTANGYTLIDADTTEDTGKFGTQVTPPLKTYTGFTSPSPKTLTITSNELANLVEYQYVRNKYNLTINPNGGTYKNSTSNTTTSMYYGASQIIENPTKTGYTFTNWTVPDGTMTDKVFTMGTSNVTLTANYQINKYIITFDATGGAQEQATKEVIYNGNYGTLPVPTRSGYEFDGWYTSQNDGNKVSDNDNFTVNNNQILYARWIPYATTKVMTLAETNTNELRIDRHEATGQQTFDATEYRYYGSNPNNYVQFNNELWRIIGAMDVDNGTGKVEKRLKIIRPTSIGIYSWDTSASNVNNGWGINEWSQADLMILLNSGAYYNRTTGTCYNAGSNKTTSCNFTTTGLTTEAKELISNAKWYLGTGEDIYATSTTNDFYINERSTKNGKQCSSGIYCNDSVVRKTEWVGQIGLISPSDYGYSADMKTCATTSLSSYNNSCKNNAWLYDISNNMWMITPHPAGNRSNQVFMVDSSGLLTNEGSNNPLAVLPVTYLKYDIKIIDGIGTEQQPFILSK